MLSLPPSAASTFATAVDMSFDIGAASSQLLAQNPDSGTSSSFNARRMIKINWDGDGYTI